MSTGSASPLAIIEPRLRWLLPADLYVSVWLDPSPANLTRVFEHLRTLQHALYDYLPRDATRTTMLGAEGNFEWQAGTLMFTDLVGFTSLLESFAVYGRAGAEALLTVLNDYFAEMIAIISKAGGNLLEFTGDALLAQFPRHPQHNDDALRAVRAGLRMQRAMERFQHITTAPRALSLGMRVGIHSGPYLTATIGTPRRREYVLLGSTVQHTKQAESMGAVGRVNVSRTVQAQLGEIFRLEAGKADYTLVIDDLSAEQLGDYDLAPGRRRAPTGVLLDRSVDGLVLSISEMLQRTEQLASYIPRPILTLLVESAAERKIRPEFPELTVMFVNLTGVPSVADTVQGTKEPALIAALSQTFALISAAVEARGGVLKNVACDHTGSSMLIYFGVPDAHTDDTIRASATALVIREIAARTSAAIAVDSGAEIACQIGIACGPVFAAEIGEPRGRREFNILGDTVNTAARLMARAQPQQILMTEPVYQAVAARFQCVGLDPIPLKGKAVPVRLYTLHDWIETERR